MERERSRGTTYEDREREAERRGTERPARELARREGPYLTRRDPYYGGPYDMMRYMLREMNRPFEGWPFYPAAQSSANWPLIEMFDKDGRFVVRAELPGVSKDDVKLRVLEDSLVIEGERRSEHETRREGFYESEWSYGHFSRRIPLPAPVDPDDVRAKFKDGILEVEVRVQAPAAREIPIETR